MILVTSSKKINDYRLNFIGRSRLNGKWLYQVLLSKVKEGSLTDITKLGFSKENIHSLDGDMHVCESDKHKLINEEMI